MGTLVNSKMAGLVAAVGLICSLLFAVPATAAPAAPAADVLSPSAGLGDGEVRIFGTVTDSEGNAPKYGGSVVLMSDYGYEECPCEYYANTDLDEAGNYSFEGVDPGNYILIAHATYLSSEFWENANSASEATVITVRSGDVFGPFNFELEGIGEPPVPEIRNLTYPTIPGAAAVGKTLRVKPGTYAESGVTLRYQWYADRKPIKGATKSSLKLTSAHVGKRIYVSETAIKPGFAILQPVWSNFTEKVGYPSKISVKTKSLAKRKVRFSVAVKSNKKAAKGKIVIYRGAKKIKTVKLDRSGKAAITLKKQPKGKSQYVVKYAGSSKSRAASKAIVVKSKK